MTIENWVELITAILVVIGGAIALLVKFARKGDGKTVHPPKYLQNNTDQSTTQTSTSGPNISASNGGTVSINVQAPQKKLEEEAAVQAPQKSLDGETDVHTPQKTTEEETQAEGLQNEFSEIKLASTYTSLFAEENKLKTERIVITKQEHGIIAGFVELRETDSLGREQLTLTYSLEGRFSNKILTAEYYSKEDARDERGAINLKLIDTNILSGFCSFSKLSSMSDDEIRVSPYIWVAGENVDLLNGTYSFCTDCYKQKAVCCCASEEIDMPLFLDSEVNAIRSGLSKKRRSTKYYSQPLAAPYDQCHVRQISRQEKNTSDGQLEYSRCYFFDMETKNCKIYSGRPIDCRLFPFDIRLSGNRSEYIIGYYPDLCDRELPEFFDMKKYAHILRPYFFLLYPYLHIITSEVACERLKDADFKEIGKFKDFVF